MSEPAAFRDRFLGFLKSRAPGAAAPEVESSEGAAHVGEPRRPAVAGHSGAPPAGELRARFTEALHRVGGEVHDLREARDPRSALRELLAALRTVAGQDKAQPRAAIDGDPTWVRLKKTLPVAEVAAEAGFEVRQVPGAGRSDTGELAGCALGITCADLAIADTGTLLQIARPWRPRSISLLPPVHLAIVPEDRLVASLEDVLAQALGDLERGSATVLITGPSRTADIEKVLTVGVHGPGRLIAVLVPAAE